MEQLSLKESRDDFIVPIGKYKGTNILDVFDSDQQYFEWMYNNCELSSQFANVLENMLTTGIPF